MGRTQDSAAGAEVFRFDQSEALLRNVMEHAAVGMALIGLDRRLIYVNNAFAEMLGYDADACLGADFGTFVHDDCNAAVAFHMKRLAIGEIDSYRAECQLKHRDGSAIWALASASELRSEQTGKPIYVILQVVNIDRQKRAEEALAYSESRWNFALEAAGQGVWDHDIRTDGMFYSNQWRRMRGIPDGEYVDPAQQKWLERVHPEDVPKILSTVQKQDAGEAGFDTLEYRERHRDGHYLWILSRGRPVEWDANGVPVRTIGTDTDITRLKTVEAELAAEKERLRVTLESIGDGVISTDTACRIAFMNPVAERMTGIPAADAVGRPLERVFIIVDETTGAPAANPVAQCLESGDVATAEEDVLLVSRDGTRCDIRSSASPLRTPSGELIGSVLVFQDVTSSRTLQKQLVHSATHDALTGLPNRVAFERALGAVVAETRRDHRQHGLCFVDLDRFKPVNDGAGHAAGDALLHKVGEVIRRNCRKQDFAARIGGDEFALLLADCSPEAAVDVAEKIAGAIAGIRFAWDGATYTIGASIGVTAITARSGTPMELMSEADAACYVAKAQGRGRVATYTPSEA
jgi:diguanylate cyclase (GGDEF)-like protein/PAS domain S-box-containing protein